MRNLKQLTMWLCGIIIATLLTQNIKLQLMVNRYQNDDARRAYVMAAYSVKNDSISNDTMKINTLCLTPKNASNQ